MVTPKSRPSYLGPVRWMCRAAPSAASTHGPVENTRFCRNCASGLAVILHPHSPCTWIVRKLSSVSRFSFPLCRSLSSGMIFDASSYVHCVVSVYHHQSTHPSRHGTVHTLNISITDPLFPYFNVCANCSFAVFTIQGGSFDISREEAFVMFLSFNLIQNRKLLHSSKSIHIDSNSLKRRIHRW